MNKGIRLAAIEDDISELSLFSEMLSTFFESEGRNYSLISFPDAESYLAQNRDFDAVFFDIELPGMTGMELSRKLREAGNDVPIIFITHMAQFAIEGYEVSAVDFILKPLKYPEFSLKLKKLIRILDNRAPSEKTISLKKGGSMIFLKEDEIYYLEVKGHSLTYHSKKGDIELRSPMVEEESKLSSSFAHSSDSYLINLEYVRKISKAGVVVSMDGKEGELPLTRKYKDSFRKTYLAYLEANS